MYYFGKKKSYIGAFPMKCFVGFYDITFQKVKWKKSKSISALLCFFIRTVFDAVFSEPINLFCFKVDSSKESAEAACDILSQLVNCSLKTLGLISTARPSFMDLPKVIEYVNFSIAKYGSCSYSISMTL